MQRDPARDREDRRPAGGRARPRPSSSARGPGRPGRRSGAHRPAGADRRDRHRRRPRRGDRSPSPGADFEVGEQDTLVLVASHRDMDRAFRYLTLGRDGRRPTRRTEAR
ncbi:MAG: hypothetical protein M0C28_38985 [Candidatus Moduliflexus flocculans]|nr:hypothetical protein [Candidatus Moduliflexus flocculans]